MEIVALLIVGYVIYGVYKNYEAQKKKRPGSTETEGKAVVQVPRRASARPSAPPVISESLKEMTEALFKDGHMRQKNQPARPKAMEEGQSRVDLEGCVGGSMDHGDEHEMDTHSNLAIEPELPLVKISLKESVKAQAQENAGRPLSHRGLDAAHLRQAVVVSEILSKPVAMRGGRRYGVR